MQPGHVSIVPGVPWEVRVRNRAGPDHPSLKARSNVTRDSIVNPNLKVIPSAKMPELPGTVAVFLDSLKACSFAAEVERARKLIHDSCRGYKIKKAVTMEDKIVFTGGTDHKEFANEIEGRTIVSCERKGKT